MGNPNVYEGGAGLFTAEYEKGRTEPPYEYPVDEPLDPWHAAFTPVLM